MMRLFEITAVAVTMFMAMMFGFLGMCGVNVHIYSIISAITIAADAVVVYRMLDQQEKQQDNDSEN